MPQRERRPPVRVVLDTNVLVAALLSPSGPPDKLLSYWEAGAITLVTSRPQQHELARVLAYPKLQLWIRTDAAQLLLEKLDHVAEIALDLPTIEASVDSDDNLILATAIAGNADCLVSGDKKHLLPLKSVEGIPIVTVTDILTLLANTTRERHEGT